MTEWTEYTKFMISLLAIIDPFLAIPVFLAVTEGKDIKERTRTAGTISITVASILLLAAFAGERILLWMGTSLASFRVGGGLIILLMALSMLHAQTGSLRQTPEEKSEIQSGSGIVPVSIPLLAGPGAISTVIIAMNRTATWNQKAVLILCILAVCLIMWMVLRSAAAIGDALGKIGLNLISRLLGLILAAIAIEIMANGLKQLFPALVQLNH